MSVLSENFELPDISDARCEPPRDFELKQLRAVGLNPEEWVLVKLSKPCPFVVLRNRRNTSVHLVLTRRAK